MAGDEGAAEAALLEEVRPMWQETLRAAASLARSSADFRAAAKGRASAWAVREEGRGMGSQVAELEQFRAAVYG